MTQREICREPEVMDGAPMFCGRRVPAQTLLDYLEVGVSINQFLEVFPSMTGTQVIAFLEQAKDHLVESLA